MALQSSGQIKLSEIAAEYGGSEPHALSEYHDKGNAPASGEIQIAADFYGTSNTFSFSITSNASQVNLRSTAVSAGWDGSSQLLATINSGVIIYSGSTGTPAMTIDGSYPGGVVLTNNGTILGKGGQGGSITAGSEYSGQLVCNCSCCSDGQTSSGGAGGTGLYIASAVTINNAGRISGGGGGGGAGGQVNAWNQPGAAGGGGIGNGAGGTAGWGGSGNGGAGTLTSAGGAGGRCICTEGTYLAGGAGGSGGSYGASGGSGGNAQCGGNTNCPSGSGRGATGGGSGGAATSGQSNVTWTATGTRNGTVG